MNNWLDKYEQGGMVLKQKTKDNYGKKANPNNPDVSLPPGFKGLAYNTKGRNYSPAWGGQFQMGGSLPGAVGFTYARTQGIPSEGPYAKKTMPSAQDGIISSLSSAPLNLLNKALGLFGNQPSQTPQVPQKEEVLPTLNVFDKISQKYNEKYRSFYDKWEANNKIDPENKSKNPVVLDTGRFRGAKVEPTMIDDLIKAAESQGVDPWLMVALAGRESTFGSGTLTNQSRSSNKDQIVSGWTVTEDYVPRTIASFLADKKVPGVNTYKHSGGWTYDIARGQIKSVEDYLNNHPEIVQSYYKQLEKTPDIGDLGGYDLAAKRIKEKGLKSYNPGDPNYSKAVIDDMSTLKNDKAMAAYMKSRGFQNGGEMKFYQEGLDWKPRNISRDGSEIPQAQMGTMVTPLDFSKPLGTLEGVSDVISAPARTATYLLTGKYQDPSQALGIKNPWGALAADMVLDPVNLIGVGVAGKVGKAAKAAVKASKESGVLSKAHKLNPKAYHYNLPKDVMWRGLGKEGMEDAVESGLFRAKQNVIPEYYPGSKLQINKSFGENPYFTPKFNTAATYGDNFIAEVPRDVANWRNRYGRGKTWSQVADRPIPIDQGRILQKDWLKGYKEVPKPKKKEDGGDIKKDDNGYWNPENWGEPVEIGSNEITMQGVYEPLLGISDTGDTQMMYPGEDYTFDGESVTEYPVAKGGISVNNADAQPIKKLDQSLNFTNYNKPTKGGWLDKYN